MQVDRISSPLKLLTIALKTGRVTKKYPFGPPLLTESFRGAISIDPAKCWGCGACVLVCPPNALTMMFEEGRAILEYFKGRCIFCGMCADVCPANAITVTKEFELAATNLEDLKEGVIHRLSTCAVCGKPFAPAAELRDVMKMHPIVEEYANICPECRKKRAAKAFGLSFGAII
uniref:4Fe-4S dicluster domain-containing protein n=1 Tax=Ignisphaera aggregans TaxID=334771 RepID=A0A7C4BBZ3_9CREN